VKVVPEALARATPTLRDVAARVGVSYATARAWRTGSRIPTLKGRRRLAAALRKQADKLNKMADRIESESAVLRGERNAQLELNDGFIADFL
jgi:transcriptional regulator with XRE-family HTH domain